MSETLNAIRDAQGFKLHFWNDPEGYENDGPHKVEELYFLPDDIDESDNLYSKRPDIVKRLTEAARTFDAKLIRKSRPPGKVP